MLQNVIATVIAGGAKALTGAQCQWIGCGPHDQQRIYFANHSSHLDFLLLWSALPKPLRRRTRPVAAADYWSHSGLKRYLMGDIFNGVPVERDAGHMVASPLRPMTEALDAGSSLIIFPEGTRGNGEDLQPFRGGIYYLARARPNVDLVPVWMENCYRVMPKGSVLPVPLLCSVRFGAPTRLRDDEDRAGFVERLRNALGEIRCA